jgi:hypothetical protein
MYLGLRLSHTLPGNPTPARKVLSRLADSNSGTSLDAYAKPRRNVARPRPGQHATAHPRLIPGTHLKRGVFLEWLL